MPTDGIKIKKEIIEIIKLKGPSLPVQIAKETGLSILFASAFLSELFSEKEVKMSNLRIGSSPLYFILGQEPELEKFSMYLKGKEKEAFLLLKEKKILIDSEQLPAIRVALREIKDFAIPFEKEEKILWKYFLVSEQQILEYFSNPKELSVLNTELESLKEEPQKELVKNSEEETKEDLKESQNEIKEIKQEEVKVEKKKIIKKEKTAKKTLNKKSSKPDKKNENFFNKIKESLAKEGIEIIDIKDFKNDEATILVNNKGKEELKFFFNKKKISEKEILSCFKKAQLSKLDYTISFFGEPSKKLQELISAIKGLSKLDKIKE